MTGEFNEMVVERIAQDHNLSVQDIFSLLAHESFQTVAAAYLHCILAGKHEAACAIAREFGVDGSNLFLDHDKTFHDRRSISDLRDSFIND